MESKISVLKIIRCLEESAMALDPRVIERLAQIRKDVIRRAANRERNSAGAVLSQAAVLRDSTTR